MAVGPDGAEGAGGAPGTGALGSQPSEHQGLAPAPGGSARALMFRARTRGMPVYRNPSLLGGHIRTKARPTR